MICVSFFDLYLNLKNVPTSFELGLYIHIAGIGCTSRLHTRSLALFKFWNIFVGYKCCTFNHHFFSLFLTILSLSD